MGPCHGASPLVGVHRSLVFTPGTWGTVIRLPSWLPMAEDSGCAGPASLLGTRLFPVLLALLSPVQRQH